MTSDEIKAQVQQWLPTAKAIRVYERGSKGFRFVIEYDDFRISGNHPRMAEAWADAWKRVIGPERCENCCAPIHLVNDCCSINTVWVHADNGRTCWCQPEDGMASPADVYTLAKMADRELP